MRKISLSLKALSFAALTVWAPTVFAENIVALPDISPEQIARDIERRQNPQTGAVEYHAPNFDPFESVDNIIGTTALRSNTRSTSIDGNIVRGGALLDVNFFYSTDSDDPYDVAGFESAVFLSGEDINTTYYDNRIIECSSDIHDVVYQQDYYNGASYGLIGGIYRPFPRYRGHRFFGTLGYSGFGWSFPTGAIRRGSFVNSRRFNNRRNFRHTNQFSDRSRRTNPDRTNRFNRDQGRNPGDFQDRRDGREERRNDRRDARGNDVRGDNVRNNDQTGATRSPVKRRVIRRGLNTIKGQQNNAQPSSQNRSSLSTIKRTQSQSVTPRSPISRSVATVKQPSPVSRNSAPSSQTRSSSSSTRSPNRSSDRASSGRNNQSSNRSSSSSNRSSSRSSNRSVSRSTNRSFQRSNPSNSRRKLNFFPQTSFFGRSTRTVRTTTSRCAREENLTLHISRERLDAARFDGLTIFALDRDGQDIPIYIPPNYIQAFQSTVYGQPQTYQQSAPNAPQYQSYQDPAFQNQGELNQGYQDQGGQIQQGPSSQPRIYGDPTGVTSDVQNEVFGGYPRN